MKKINYFKIYILSFLFLGLLSCDKIEAPYVETINMCGEETESNPIRKILLEDYTGHTCGNCPAAARLINDSLKTRYCEHIIPISIHSGWFGRPTTDFPDDLTTNVGLELGGNGMSSFGEFNIQPQPAGIINRTPYGENLVLTTTETWSKAIAKLLETPPEMDIDIENTYDTITNNLTINITVKFIKAFPNNKLNLVLYLTEDSVISKQTDYEIDPPNVIDNYVNRHVLRDGINGTWGQSIVSGSIGANQILKRTFTYTVDNKYKEKNCSVIAFVCEAKPKYNIYQAEEKKIME